MAVTATIRFGARAFARTPRFWRGDALQVWCDFTDQETGAYVAVSSVAARVWLPAGSLLDPAPVPLEIAPGIWAISLSPAYAGTWRVEMSCSSPDEALDARDFLVVASEPSPVDPAPPPISPPVTVGTWNFTAAGARSGNSTIIDGQFYFGRDDGGALFRAQGLDTGAGGAVGLFVSCYSTANPVAITGHRDLGTRVAPAAVTSGQQLLNITGKATLDGIGTQSNGGSLICMATADQTPSSAPTRWRVTTTPTGSITPQSTLDIAISDGLRFGGQLVLNSDRHFVLRSYTVATLPTAGAPARLIVVSDGSSFRRLAIADGGVWRFMDGSIVS